MQGCRVMALMLDFRVTVSLSHYLTVPGALSGERAVGRSARSNVPTFQRDDGHVVGEVSGDAPLRDRLTGAIQPEWSMRTTGSW